MNVKIIGLYCEITSVCNFSCIHCYNDSKIKGYELPFEVLSKVIKTMKELEVPYIALSGGEPTLHSRFRDVVELLNTHGIAVDVVTNGSQLEAFEDVLNSVRYLQISLDGASSVTNDKIRGKGSFEKVVSQIEHVSQRIREKITLKLVLNAYNSNEIVEYINLAERLNVQRVSFGWLNDLGRAKGKYDLAIDDREKLRIIDVINDQKNQRKNIEVVPLGTTEKCPYVNEEGNETINMSLRIDSRGDIYPCQLISCRQFVLGNIFDLELDELSNCDAVNTFFEFAKGRQSNISECQQCVWNSVCKGGCIGDGMSDQNLYSPDRQCLLRRISFRKNIMNRRKKNSVIL